MPVLSRSLLLYLALAAAALLTWMLARNSERESDSTDASPTRRPQGYYLKNTVLSATDLGGAIEFRVHAGRVDRASSVSDYSLEDVRVEYAEEPEVAWRLTAYRGTLTPDRGQLELQSVRVRAQSTAQAERGAETFEFETRDLSVDLRAKTAVTRQPVQLRKGQCEFNAMGLNVDLIRNTYELLDVVTICRPGPAPVLAIALFAGAAVAQEEPAGETYQIACAQWAGDFVTDQHVCTDIAITDRGSFRLTAGSATVNSASVPQRVEQSEWRLTETVRLEFETAVLVAEAAAFSFDDEGLLASFDMSGSPSELSDYIDGRALPVRVRAQRIVYDRQSGVLKMPGTVEILEDGENGSGAKGCDLTYRLDTKAYTFGNRACAATLSLAPTAPKDSEVTIIDEP
jgi:LPS export ABC transporter protein LptC